MPTIDANGSEVYYERKGNGPILMIVHGGLGMDHTSVKYMYDFLEEDFEVIYFDLKGHGKSSGIDTSNFTYDELVDNIEDFRHTLGINNFILLGFSAGGYIALMYAEKYHSNLKGLIIESGFHTEKYDDDAKVKEIIENAKTRMPDLATEYETLVKTIQEHGADTPMEKKIRAQVLSQYSYFYNYKKSFRELTGQVMADTIFQGEIAQRDVELRKTLNIDLSKIGVPALLITGKYNFTPMKTLEEMDNLIPKSELHIFEKSGHYPSSEEREKYIPVLRNWFNSLN